MTRKCFFLFSVMCFSNAIVYAQSGNNLKLDEHRNFKEINLGDSFEKWSEKLTYRDSNGSATQYVLDTNYCCGQLFDFEAELVTVIFENKKVVRIEIYLKKFQESHTDIMKGIGLYESIERQFNFLFGNPYSRSKNRENPLIKTQWVGNKTALGAQYNYYGVANGDAAIVIISDLDYSIRSIKSGF
jgi:hypothetical protein